MTSITYGELRDLQFYSAMSQLANAEEIRLPSVQMKIAKIYRQCIKHWKTSDKCHQELLEKFAQKDETGAFKRSDDGSGKVVLEPETKEEYAAAEEAFFAIQAGFDFTPLHLEEIAEAKLSPAQIAYIFPFIDQSSGADESPVVS